MSVVATPIIRIGLLGAGIFATASHAPVLRALARRDNDAQDVSIVCVAIWSRTSSSAMTLAGTFPKPCDSYHGEEGLSTMLGRDDIDAVSIVLPMDVQPRYVTRALEAGKHVLSEKAIALTVADGRRLLEEYDRVHRPGGLRWSVAENFRYEPAVVRAGELIGGGAIGTPLAETLVWNAPFRRDNPYLQTQWRSSLAYSNKGGLLIDVLVHGIAALRHIAGEAGLVPSAVSGFVSKAKEVGHIPGPDTLSAVVKFIRHHERPKNNGGFACNVSATFASEDKRFELAMTGTEGRVEVKRSFGGHQGHGYHVTTLRAGNETSSEFYCFQGVEAEYRAFAKACWKEEFFDLDRNTPGEAISDLALVEAVLKSDGSQVSLLD